MKVNLDVRPDGTTAIAPGSERDGYPSVGIYSYVPRGDQEQQP
jgi:hypothetical protein